MAEDLGSASLSLEGDLSPLRRDLATARSEADSSGKRAGRVFGTAMRAGLLAVGAIAAGAVIGIKKSIDAASDLNEAVNATSVTFGKAQKTLIDFADQAATQAGLSKRAFLELVTPIGAALQNYGFSAQEAADQSVNLAKRAADMASVFNVDVGEAMQAIQAGLRGEADPLERFGVGLNETAVNAYAVKNGIAAAGTELTAHQKTQARLALLMEQTNRVQGDFVNTSDGLANQQRILRAEFENVTAEVGTALLPVASKLMGLLLQGIPIVRDLANRFMAFLTPALDSASAKGGQLHGIFQTVLHIAMQLWRVFKKYLLPVILDIGRLSIRVWTRIAAVIERNRPAINRILERFGKLVHLIWVVLKPILELVFVQILPRVINIAIKVVDKVSAAIEKVIRWLVRVRDSAKEVWGRIADFVGNVIDKVQLVIDKVRSFFQIIQNGISKISGPLGKVADAFGSIAGAAGKLNPFGGDGIVSAAGPRSISSTLFDDLALGQAGGLVMTSGYRPGAITSTGNPSLHGVYPAKAIDMAGSEAAMRRYFLLEVARGAATGLREVIHSPFWWHPGAGIQRIPASAGSVLADHYSHVHVGSYDLGGLLMPGLTLAWNNTGAPERVLGPGQRGGGIVFNFPRYSGSRRELIADVTRGLDEHRSANGGRDPW